MSSPGICVRRTIVLTGLLIAALALMGCDQKSLPNGYVLFHIDDYKWKIMNKEGLTVIAPPEPGLATYSSPNPEITQYAVQGSLVAGEVHEPLPTPRTFYFILDTSSGVVHTLPTFGALTTSARSVGWRGTIKLRRL
jgi:hypothetical protein